VQKAYAAALIIGVTIVAVVSIYIFYHPHQGVQVFNGSFFVSDAGQSHGGFEYVAVWNATLTVNGPFGELSLIFAEGLGDVLTKHEYLVSEFVYNQSTLSMKVDGKPLTLVWTPVDAIWNHEFDNYYIASWGGDAPAEEIRGTISPTIFPGLVEFYYVELRLK
jgi:hypothetical protein